MLGSPPLVLVSPLGAGLAVCNIFRFGEKNTVGNDFVLIIFINCNWVIARWQWLFYMYIAV
jgi:hypothetical protein